RRKSTSSTPDLRRSSSNAILKLVTCGFPLCDVLLLLRMEPKGGHLCQAAPPTGRSGEFTPLLWTLTPWSTGPVEGIITRIKFMKRLGYGRASLALLRARVLGVR